MANEIWPVTWPDGAPTEADADKVALAEDYAARTMRMLTLYRVGGRPITVMPCSTNCRVPRYSAFRPVELLSAADLLNCGCTFGCSCDPIESVYLTAPVGRIDEVVVDGAVLPVDAYHVEDGNILVRTDGGRWPSCSGDDFTVTYLNGYPVDSMGQYVAGVLAQEYLNAMTASKNKCKLPPSVTSLTRQGVTIEMTTGLFPEGVTGITIVDTYLRQFNPHGLKTKPTVHSPDLDRRQRQVTLP